MFWGCYFFLFCSLFLGVLGTPPELIDKKLWFVNHTILNYNYEVAVVQMEFDQDLFLVGENFVCGKAEQTCPDLDCVPCDWSSQEPSGCDDTRCCGPAQIGGEIADQANEWCEESTPYQTLKIGEKSEIFSVEPKETVYFRFFIAEENYCTPFRIAIRPYYGAPILFLSNTRPFPTVENAEWRKGVFVPPRWSWGQNPMVVCPTAHRDYQIGTFSLGVYNENSGSFDVEILLAPEEYPLVPPPNRISCDDVPEEEIISAKAGSDQDVFCLQDTETFERDYSDVEPGFEFQFVLPIPAGCQNVSVTVTSPVKGTDPDIFCHPRDTNKPTTLDNCLKTQHTLGEDRFSFAMCAEEISYVRCAVWLWVPGEIFLMFTTVAEPIFTPLVASADTPAAHFSYMETLSAVAAVIHGQAGTGCSDFLGICNFWQVPSISDPLVFWPPSPELPKIHDIDNVYKEYFLSTDAQPLEKTLTLVVVLTSGSEVIYTRDQFDQIALSFNFITNELGETPNLPSNSPDLNEKTPHSPSVYLPSIVLSDFLDDEIDITKLCDHESYEQIQDIVKDQIERTLATDSLTDIEFHKYVLDIIDASIAASSCTQAAIKVMNTQVEEVTLIDQIYCQYEVGTPEYDNDACCNLALLAFDCCSPFTVTQDVDQFTSADSSACGFPQCADTYFEDLGRSLNHVADQIQGCSSGIANLQDEFGTLSQEQLDRVMRTCLNQVGLGDSFEGIDCVADFQCEQWSGQCNHQTQKCVIGTLPEVEDAFLQCYLSKMGSSLEEYLRLNVLPPEATSAPLHSTEFFMGLKSAATVEDCVSIDDALDLSFRERYVWSATSIACKADVLGLPEDDIEGINALCPDGHCLGTSCRQSSAQCFKICEPAYNFHPSSEDECISSSTVCPVTGLPGDDCEGNYCMYCPGGEGEECVYVPGDQDFCENTVACEVDGKLVLGLTEEECNAQSGSCSVECLGESCRSLDKLSGACLASVDSETLCENLNSISGVEATWYDDSICVVNAETEATCTELSSLISAATTWETCESVTTTSCNGDDAFQRYLKCFVDKWHPCENQEECENSGHCSDREWTTIVRSDEHPVDVQYGACFSSGFYITFRHCWNQYDRPGIGCRDPSILVEGDCFDQGGQFRDIRAWLTPATSETECRNKDLGRYGCQLPDPEDHLVWFDDEQCDCGGGVNDYAWDWSPGVWSNGVSRALHWQEIKPVEKYQWIPALSFELLQTWLVAAVEQKFSYVAKSEVICENTYVASSLDTLVCDSCFLGLHDEDHEGHEDHEEDDCNHYLTGSRVEEFVGVTSACFDEESFTKSPSSRVTFEKDSLETGCTIMNLSIVSEAWFVNPPPRPSISFEFEEKPTRGIVLNKKGATVGVLRGAGSVLSFTTLASMKSFTVCLLVREAEDSPKEGRVPDFGYSVTPTGTIYPLGLQNINVSISFDSEFWCSSIKIADVPRSKENENVVRLYPISRDVEYENSDADYTSHKTRALMYTLGVCYCICFVCFVFYLINFVLLSRRSEMLGIISVSFVLLCIFRVIFMFGYPNALFEDNELAEFVVFEIPTFLLFSVVIVSIFFWKRLIVRKGFFTSNSHTLMAVIALGLVCVWSLWIIVTIIYSEVILEEDGESPCPGRVAPSYDKQEEDTRTLTIIYQSLIISVTFVLASIFCYYSFTLLNQTKSLSSSKRFVMVIGGVIVLSFFLRSILFIIILAAEFKSSIYMFITLMITEVLVMFFLQLQFNFSIFGLILKSGTTSGSTQTNTRTSNSRTLGNGADMDD